ncbi:ciliary microtubule inner protein 2B isoform X2 [Sminthopsis crassicaudata]|uniref:ciliary microtubule inner protein 2B isoform X2 n=1 Tax=Sminthopsis crassicaudata TaxID=9301 RepID=UPI003D6984C2
MEGDGRRQNRVAPEPGRRSEKPRVQDDNLVTERALNNLPSLVSNTTCMIMGFVPRSQHIFAKRCTQVWAEALRDFTSCLGTGYKELLETEKKELESKAEDEKESEKRLKLELQSEQKPKASPYSMDDRDPEKFFISGFTGFVPRARFHFGSSFPVLTNQALQEFGQMCPGARGQRNHKRLPSLSRTYLKNLGMVPCYRDYVPGENWDGSLNRTGEKEGQDDKGPKSLS